MATSFSPRTNSPQVFPVSRYVCLFRLYLTITDVLDKITEIRSDVINLLLDPIYEYLGKLLSTADDRYESETFCAMRRLCSNLRRDCFNLQASSFVANLRKLGLWPRKMCPR